MSHLIISVFCIVIGFMLGVGSMFTSTQAVISFQNRKIAALRETYSQLELLNVKQERHYMEVISRRCQQKRK